MRTEREIAVKEMTVKTHVIEVYCSEEELDAIILGLNENKDELHSLDDTEQEITDMGYEVTDVRMDYEPEIQFEYMR